MYYSTHECWNTFCGATGNHKKTTSRKPYCFWIYLRSESFNAWRRKPLNILRLVFITPVVLLWTHISLGWRSEAQGELKGDRSCQHTLEKTVFRPNMSLGYSANIYLVWNNDNTCVYFSDVLPSFACCFWATIVPFFCLLREIHSALFVLLACCVDSFHRFRCAQIKQ